MQRYYVFCLLYPDIRINTHRIINYSFVENISGFESVIVLWCAVEQEYLFISDSPALCPPIVLDNRMVVEI